MWWPPPCRLVSLACQDFIARRMKALSRSAFLPLLAAILAWLAYTATLAAAAPTIAPAEAAKLVAAGEAVLIDVREAAEWKSEGVAAPAVLLAKSDFDAAKKDWQPFLEKHAGKQLILYCRSGRRSGIIAEELAKQGLKTANGGAFKDWVAAGLPVRKPDEPAK